ncbi:DUF3037 domain-containing protein [Clostridium swellfunianum]|uniref:DUF3037 domain-containing protein n=1 Tax=Clostridium swellfunianum TaxID=1367462 RepID=UPI0020303660|nr:DUF3037 domain-containing protein [Clostridium swellfunianum]MCM0648687.1 DUF3037 domain-containing protein [Clostridium swellfunianum]
MAYIKFSVFCHYTSFLTKECINLGILFHNITENIYRFEYTTNWKRVSNFNDELDIEFLKIQLEGIKDEVESKEFTFSKNNSIENYIRFYANDFKFTEITITEEDDFESFIEETKKMILRFDFSKEKRPNKDDQYRYLKNILKNKNIDFSSKRTQGYFSESLNFDLILGNYAFKFFTFEGKMPSHLVSSVKSWAYDAYKLKGTYNLVFVADADFSTDNKYKVIFDILQEESSYFMTFSEVIPFIEKINLNSEVLNS